MITFCHPAISSINFSVAHSYTATERRKYRVTEYGSLFNLSTVLCSGSFAPYLRPNSGHACSTCCLLSNLVFVHARVSPLTLES